ncbi:MAG: nickel pincer cofactor biosynthesis protein LarB [Rubripirellula sp.]|nr:nickel pincer cofactor biosynthesis protein LarB [Planctomycetaceae bacterium]MDF1841306.1 nickel pincer cofactor biosynthesis protein LarB [Rubripirellula sp.]
MTSVSPALLELLSKVLAGQASSEELSKRIEQERNGASDPNEAIESGQFRRIRGATVDLGRSSRCGFGEVIFGEGKPAELVTQIIQTQLDAGQSALVTRIDSEVAFRVRQGFKYSLHNPVARTLRIESQDIAAGKPLTMDEAAGEIHAAVVTAGSTDQPVAEEAIETLTWMGVPHTRFDDIGVAGPQRLQAALPALRLASVVVVVAGMEGALPSVVAGHLSVPVFAVPTSVGYGASLGGLTALLGMLSACVASIAVVNIDAGFKGGYLAGMVASQLNESQSRMDR